VSLVAILDADKEGFLRSEKALIQTIGRAARNVNAEVILYADTVTDAMQRAVDETNRRRQLQLEYNRQHNITPRSVQSAIRNAIEDIIQAHKLAQEAAGGTSAAQDDVTYEYLQQLHQEMLEAAQTLDFERAQTLRDQIVRLEADLKKRLGDAAPPSVFGTKAVPVGLPQSRKRSARSRKR
jgi:excinuclease ABC subunit B